MALDYRGSFLLVYAVDQQLSTLPHQAMGDCPLTPEELQKSLETVSRAMTGALVRLPDTRGARVDE